MKLKTLDGLRERYPDEAPPSMRFRKRWRRSATGGEAEDSEVRERLEQVAGAIEEGGADIEAWEFPSKGFDLMRPGLEREYRRGRRALRAMPEDPPAEAVHGGESA